MADENERQVERRPKEVAAAAATVATLGSRVAAPVSQIRLPVCIRANLDKSKGAPQLSDESICRRGEAGY
jgi:hypothetical protein